MEVAADWVKSTDTRKKTVNCHTAGRPSKFPTEWLAVAASRTDEPGPCILQMGQVETNKLDFACQLDENAKSYIRRFQTSKHSEKSLQQKVPFNTLFSKLGHGKHILRLWRVIPYRVVPADASIDSTCYFSHVGEVKSSSCIKVPPRNPVCNLRHSRPEDSVLTLTFGTCISSSLIFIGLQLSRNVLLHGLSMGEFPKP
jgi:hypothetical protein